MNGTQATCSFSMATIVKDIRIRWGKAFKWGVRDHYKRSDHAMAIFNHWVFTLATSTSGHGKKPNVGTGLFIFQDIVLITIDLNIPSPYGSSGVKQGRVPAVTGKGTTMGAVTIINQKGIDINTNSHLTAPTGSLIFHGRGFALWTRFVGFFS